MPCKSIALLSNKPTVDEQVHYTNDRGTMRWITQLTPAPYCAGMAPSVVPGAAVQQRRYCAVGIRSWCEVFTVLIRLTGGWSRLGSDLHHDWLHRPGQHVRGRWHRMDVDGPVQGEALQQLLCTQSGVRAQAAEAAMLLLNTREQGTKHWSELGLGCSF